VGARTHVDNGSPAVVDDIAAGPGDAWALSWFDISMQGGTPNLLEGDGLWQVSAGLASERATVGSRLAYDPLSGRPVVIWSQGEPATGHQIVAR
jgi:hypothetical protein